MATASTSLEKPSTNRGGSSRLIWFNQLASLPALESAREHLFAKISRTSTGSSGCITVDGFLESTRPVADTRFQDALNEVDEMPKRFAPYHLAMARAKDLVPSFDPPKLPKHLRKVTQKRSSTSAADNEKDATWVCSHLCHNKLCINTVHLRWEPSWFNRLRDNCPGGAACLHRPDPCLEPHRPAKELVDWTEFLAAEDCVRIRTLYRA